MTKILIADDNKQITSILEGYVSKEGYIPIVTLDGEEALEKYEREKPDLILMDVMMPKKDGFEVCREIRKHSNVPIIMVTARGEDFEKIMGLDLGADDYIVKPFSPSEVMARVRAVLRRLTKEEDTSDKVLIYDNLMINIESYMVQINKEELSLTKKEMEILWTLAKYKNKVFTRDNLLNSVWGYDYTGDSRTVDSHIKRLRAKLDAYEHPNWEIKTKWGVGYRFESYTEDKR